MKRVIRVAPDDYAGETTKAGRSIIWPRNSAAPAECYGAVAEWRPGEGTCDVTSNLQSPSPSLRAGV